MGQQEKTRKFVVSVGTGFGLTTEGALSCSTELSPILRQRAVIAQRFERGGKVRDLASWLTEAPI